MCMTTGRKWVAASVAATTVCATPLVGSELADLATFDPRRAEVILLGEVHDNALHHEGQAQLVDRIAPTAIVFEMLTPEQAEAANALRPAATEAELAVALSWAESGWPDFAIYYPIFAAAPDVPRVGAALPRSEVRRAVSEGAAALFGPDAGDYGLDQPLAPEEQALREQGQATSHCDALPGDLLPGFVEAQRLRDAHFARVTLEALAEYGAPVVVITGNGHARTDWGIPAAVAIASPGVEVLSVGQLEAAAEGALPYDLWRVTAPAEREDPCAAFQ